MSPELHEIYLCWNRNLTGSPVLNLWLWTWEDGEIILWPLLSGSGCASFNRGMRSKGTECVCMTNPVKTQCNCGSNLLEAPAKSSSKKSPTWKWSNTHSAQPLHGGRAAAGVSTEGGFGPLFLGKEKVVPSCFWSWSLVIFWSWAREEEPELVCGGQRSFWALRVGFVNCGPGGYKPHPLSVAHRSLVIGSRCITRLLYQIHNPDTPTFTSTRGNSALFALDQMLQG